MAQYKLVWVKEYGETFLSTNPPYKGKPATDATLKQIAEMCDMEAENANHHGMVGVYSWLADILTKECGGDAALRVMRTIAERGGLAD